MRCPFRNFALCMGTLCAAYSPEKKVSSFTIPESCNMFRPDTMAHASPFTNDGVQNALEKMGAKAHGEG